MLLAQIFPAKNLREDFRGYASKMHVLVNVQLAQPEDDFSTPQQLENKMNKDCLFNVNEIVVLVQLIEEMVLLQNMSGLSHCTSNKKIPRLNAVRCYILGSLGADSQFYHQGGKRAAPRVLRTNNLQFHFV